MPRPGRMPMEKANNFPMAIKRVLKSMKKWHYAVIISILLAAFGSIISLVAFCVSVDFSSKTIRNYGWFNA